MASNQRITRSEHVASIGQRPGRMAQVWGKLQRGDVLKRIGWCVLAGLLIWLITGGWKPPFAFRESYTPQRNLDARVAFKVVDEEGTKRLREQKRSELECIYRHDPGKLPEMQYGLKHSLFEVLYATSYDDLDKNIWRQFLSQEDEQADLDDKATFARARAALAEDADLTRFAAAVKQALAPFEENGLLEKLAHRPQDGSQQWIQVYGGTSGDSRRVLVKQVHTREVLTDFRRRLKEQFQQAGFPPEHVEDLTGLAYNWFVNRRLPTTLTYEAEATRLAFDRELVKELKMKSYAPGDTLVPAGYPIDALGLALLKREYTALVDNMSALDKLAYSLSTWLLYAGLFVLCGVFIFYHRPQLIVSMRALLTLLGVLVFTVALARACTGEIWQAPSVPIVLFGMTMAIAYTRDLALVLAAAVSLLLVVSLGLGIGEFVLMLATSSTAILLLNRIRTRTKLSYIGLGAALVAIVTSMGMGVLLGEPLGAISGASFSGAAAWSGWRMPASTFLLDLSLGALWHGFCALLAALIMTPLLPFIERLFDVQTDISLLELGDAAHPLLQELARRAPGTYNHSINVASLAEAAAESIGANGLLVRVGAYFHDIGKMFKPGYFVENQGRDANRHESLLPAMSTLVIIAHVKDGADLARQNRLPQRSSTSSNSITARRWSSTSIARPPSSPTTEAGRGEVDEVDVSLSRAHAADA